MNGYELIGLAIMLIAVTNTTMEGIDLFFRTSAVVAFFYGFALAYKNRSNVDDNPIEKVIDKIKAFPSEKTKDNLFGKNRKNPCDKCGNPYHSTDEHKWYH